MKITCNNDPTHDVFYTTAHRVQGWFVDKDGQFLAEIENCLEVTHKPDNENFFCAICDSKAAVED